MRLVDALFRIRKLNQDVVNTHDVAALLDIKLDHASKILSRLSDSGEIVKITRGLWGIRDRIDALSLPEKLTVPFPSYISLQTALYHHGLISQIPSVVYVVSLARSKTIKTPISTYSIHHIAPELFTGYTHKGPKNVALATPEKALFDFAYFSRTKSRFFSALPELEISDDFDEHKIENYIKLIKNKRIASIVSKRIQHLLNQKI